MPLPKLEIDQQRTIVLSHLEMDENQIRFKIDEAWVDELAAIFKAQGVVPPIDVIKGEKKYLIIKGHHTYLAAQKIGKKEGPVVRRESYEGKDAEIQKLVYQYSENHHRKNLNDMDMAYFYKRLVDSGIPVNKIPEFLKKKGLKQETREQVSARLRLNTLPEWIQHAIADGKLDQGHGKYLLPAMDSPQVMEDIEYFDKDRIEKGENISVKHIREVVLEHFSNNHRDLSEIIPLIESLTPSEKKKLKIKKIAAVETTEDSIPFSLADAETYTSVITPKLAEQKNNPPEEPEDEDDEDEDNSSATTSETTTVTTTTTKTDGRDPNTTDAFNGQTDDNPNKVKTYLRGYIIEQLIEWFKNEAEFENSSGAHFVPDGIKVLLYVCVPEIRINDDGDVITFKQLFDSNYYPLTQVNEAIEELFLGLTPKDNIEISKIILKDLEPDFEIDERLLKLLADDELQTIVTDAKLHDTTEWKDSRTTAAKHQFILDRADVIETPVIITEAFKELEAE